MMQFKEGQLVVFKGPDGYEIGKIKKIKDETLYYVWFSSGDRTTLTDSSLISPLLNDYCLEDILKKEI